MANVSRAGSCSAAGCGRSIHAKRMCKRHYDAWYRQHNADKIAAYNTRRRANPLSNADRVAKHLAQTKRCAVCGEEFSRPRNCTDGQWRKQQTCGRRCANTATARRQRKKPWGQVTRNTREAAKHWEAQRRREDREELRRKPRVGPHCRVSQRREPRHFIGGVCRGCGAMWVSYAAMHDTDLCSPCNRARWRSTHRDRAERYGSVFEPVDPEVIFKRDGYRCQLCGCRTVGKWPNLRYRTLDHIVPMAKGGDHTEANLQCACLSCNAKKGAGAMNDQLRLVV